MMSPSTLERLRKVPPVLAISLVRTPRRKSTRSALPIVVCSADVRLDHWKGMPAGAVVLLFQVRILRAVGACTLTVAVLPMAAQEPPVSTQLPSQLAVA